MTQRVHVARYGNRAGEHVLLGHSGVDPTVLDAIQWLTDLPSGPRAPWAPFPAGFPSGVYYIVRHTRPDELADRAGMVSTTVLVADEGIYTRDLRSLLGYAASEPELVAKELEPDVGLDGTSRPGLAEIVDALAETGRAVWMGDDFSGLIASVWDVLSPSDRRRLVFGLVWHPDAIPYPVEVEDPLEVYATPSQLVHRFEGWQVIRGADDEPLGPAASAIFGDRAASAASLGKQLGIEHPSLTEWSHLGEISNLLRSLDSLTGAQLRGIAHALALLAPTPDQGSSVKDKVVAGLVKTVESGDFAEVRGLRTFPSSAFPTPPDEAGLITEWTRERLNTDSAGDDAVQAATTAAGSSGPAWTTMSNALRQLAVEEPRRVLETLLELGRRDEREAFQWLADLLPGDEADKVVSGLADQGSAPDWLVMTASERGWPHSFAAVCDPTDALEAWRAYVVMPNRTGGSDAQLADRLDAQETVRAALAITDPALLQVAAAAVVVDPHLLSPAHPGDRAWRRVWSAAVEQGLNPWAVVNPGEAVPQLIAALVRGETISEEILGAAAATEFADLSGSDLRQEVWPHIPTPWREAFLDRTSRGLALTIQHHPEPIEPPLRSALLKPKNLTAVAVVDVERAVATLEKLGTAVTADAIRTVANATMLPQVVATRIGRLVRSRRLKGLAREFIRDSRRRDDLTPVADECASILGTLENLGLAFEAMVAGTGSAPTARKLHEGLSALAVTLYPEGPMSMSLWERAGGEAADLPDATTGRVRWHLALEAVAAGARGSPTMANLVEAMLDDYDRTDLRHIRALI